MEAAVVVPLPLPLPLAQPDNGTWMSSYFVVSGNLHNIREKLRDPPLHPNGGPPRKIAEKKNKAR